MSDQLINLVCYERFYRLDDDIDTLVSKMEAYGRTGGIMRLIYILVGALIVLAGVTKPAEESQPV